MSKRNEYKEPKMLSELLQQQNGMLTPEQAAALAAGIAKPAQQPVFPDEPLRVPSIEEIEYAKRVNATPEKQTVSVRSHDDVVEIIYRRAEQWLLKHNKVLLVDQKFVNLVDMLVMYFNNDERFIKLQNGFNLKKGLLLRGMPGLGKTFTLKLFAQDFSLTDGWKGNSNFLLKNFVSTKKIEAEYAGAGHKSLTQYTRLNQNYTNVDKSSGALLPGEASIEAKKIFVFDDLGAENIPVLHFGNSMNVMESILMDRYELFTDLGIRTHLTTNIVEGEMIEEIYGPRVRSRMREMFNIIDLEGQDRRI